MAPETWAHECISGMHVLRIPATWATYRDTCTAQLLFTSTEPSCEAVNRFPVHKAFAAHEGGTQAKSCRADVNFRRHGMISIHMARSQLEFVASSL